MNEDASKLEEIEWLARIAEGDRDAFAALYDRYARALYSVALRIVHEPKDAEDVLQDVFLIIWDRAHTYDPALGRPFGWALTLTRNKALDRIRQSKRRHALLQGHFAPTLAADASAVWDESIFSREQAKLIHSALVALPDEQRHAIDLAFFAGLTQYEIAEHLGQPLGTIKARIRRGMLKLRDALEGHV